MIEQKEKVGTPIADSAPTAVDAGATAVPGIIYPRCQWCPQDAPLREDGTRHGDPLRMKRLRYDYEDGVVSEVEFCADCRATMSSMIVGFTKPAVRSSSLAATKAPAEGASRPATPNAAVDGKAGR